MDTFGVIAAGPTAVLAFLILEGAYYAMIQICCNDISEYQTFHNDLRRYLHGITVKTATNIITNISAIPESLACLSSGNLEGNSEEESHVGQIDSQAASLPLTG